MLNFGHFLSSLGMKNQIKPTIPNIFEQQNTTLHTGTAE